MSKVFRLIVDEDNEPVILEEDEVLEDILIRLESISHRIDDIQYSLIKNNDEGSSLDLDISEIDFQSIKKYGVNLTPYYVIIKIQETPSYFKLPKIEGSVTILLVLIIYDLQTFKCEFLIININ